MRASRVVRQHLKTNIQTSSKKTTRPTVLKFYMEHDLTPGSQNCKIGPGRISKTAAVTKNSGRKKQKQKNSFFSRTTGHFWLNFGMEYQMNIGIQNCKNKKICSAVLSRWCYLAPIRMSKNNIFKQLQATFSLKPLHQLLSNFTWSMIRLQGFRITKLGQVKNPRWPPLLKYQKQQTTK